MKSVLSLAACAVAALATWGGSASAQDIPPGRVYVFHSTAQAGCPALDWHVVVGANGALSGMISWNNMQDMAHATGMLNTQARTFQMTAKEVGGQGRTATVSGTVRQDGWLVADVQGPNVKCQGINVPWFVPAAGGGKG